MSYDIDKRELFDSVKDDPAAHKSPKDGSHGGNPYADPGCKTCGGHGVLDVGGAYTSTLGFCGDCWHIPDTIFELDVESYQETLRERTE